MMWNERPLHLSPLFTDHHGAGCGSTNKMSGANQRGRRVAIEASSEPFRRKHRNRVPLVVQQGQHRVCTKNLIHVDG